MMRRNSTTQTNISREWHTAAADVLATAFAHYPLMRHLFGHLGTTYHQAIRSLFHFTCERRLTLGLPLLGSFSWAQLVGVAGLNLPGEEEWPAALTQAHDRFLNGIGSEAAQRFTEYAHLTDTYEPVQPHITLGVLGVLPHEQGTGHARALLDTVHTIAAAHPTATGVYTDTQVAANVTLYQHFGYEVSAATKLGDIDMWCLFRPNR